MCHRTGGVPGQSVGRKFDRLIVVRLRDVRMGVRSRWPRLRAGIAARVIAASRRAVATTRPYVTDVRCYRSNPVRTIPTGPVLKVAAFTGAVTLPRTPVACQCHGREEPEDELARQVVSAMTRANREGV